MIDKVVWLYTTPRVGQNAVLSSIRTVVPGAAEGKSTATPSDGVLVFSSQSPVILPECREVFYVWMRRRDKVAQAISWAHAAATGRFHSTQADKHHARYDRAEVERALRTIEDRELEWAERQTADHLTLVYEDDVLPDPRIAARRVLAHAGIDGDPGPTRLRRFGSVEKAAWRVEWEAGR